jgi:peptide deformylase
MYDDAKLKFYPDPVLKKVCTPVAKVDDSIRDLVTRMFAVMYSRKGVGLAAPQVGIPIRVYIVNTIGKPEGEMVLINPEVMEASGSQTGGEGCLSFPGVNFPITRPNVVRMRAAGLDGKVRELDGTALTARAFLHELDHLNGVLIVDKMSALQKMTWRKRLRQLEEDFKEGREPSPE